MCANIRDFTIRNVLRAAIGSVWVATCIVFTSRSLYLIQGFIDIMKQQFTTSILSGILEISTSSVPTMPIFGIRPTFIIAGSIAMMVTSIASLPVTLYWPGRKFVTQLLQFCGGIFSGSLAYAVFFTLINYSFKLGSIEIRNINTWESAAISLFVGTLTFYIIYTLMERWRES